MVNTTSQIHNKKLNIEGQSPLFSLKPFIYYKEGRATVPDNKMLVIIMSVNCKLEKVFVNHVHQQKE